MDVVDRLVGYLSGIEWPIAVVVGGTAAAVTVVLAHAIRNGAWEPPEELAMLGRGALRRFRSASGSPTGTRWLCATCRSWNRAEVRSCYKGCGPRELCEMPMPSADADEGGTVESAPGPQVGGRHIRRG